MFDPSEYEEEIKIKRRVRIKQDSTFLYWEYDSKIEKNINFNRSWGESLHNFMYLN